MFTSFQRLRFLCVPIRFLLCMLLLKFPKNLFISTLIGIIGLNFLILYTFKLRLNAVESLTGTTWWHKFRLIHGLLYLTAALISYSQYSNYSFVPLLLDTCLGAVLMWNSQKSFI